MVSTPVAENRQQSRKALIHAAIVISVGVLATTLAQTSVLPNVPIRNLLKNRLHVGLAANAAFFFWSGLAWYFKPIVGIVMDAFPVLGTRRRSYLLIGAVLTAASWIALIFTPREYNALLWVSIIMNVFIVIASTAVGGYMVEVAQAVSGSGRLTAIRNFVQSVCSIIIGPAGGFLAAIAFGWTCAACGGVMFLLVPATIFFLHEQRKQSRGSEVLAATKEQLVRIGTAGTMWAAAGLMALFYVAPGFGTAIFYKQQNELHLSTQSQGTLIFIGGVCGVLASVIYGFACRRFKLRTLLPWCLAFGALANLGYLFYSSWARARVIDGFNGFGYTLAELVLMDLAVRATPAGSEGLGFSLMMSVRNFALFGTDWFGSKLIERFHVPFNTLVLSNAATTLITVPLVFLLPRMLVSTKDAEPIKEPPAPRIAPQG